MISILITHYNRPIPLKVCLESLHELKLQQSYEVVVVDDGSTKDNLARLGNLKIDQLICSDLNKGLATSLNRGIKACRGEYIFYCQEDFVVKKSLAEVFQECIDLIDNKKLDMIRFRANYKFNYLQKVSDHVFKIPKFSFANFTVNAFQYSDNSFLVDNTFYEKFGYYLEGTSGNYGETEYAIRIFKSKAKIGITKEKYVIDNVESSSVMQLQNPSKRRKGARIVWKFLRALRQHVELLLYSKTNRRLYTYKNKRK